MLGLGSGVPMERLFDTQKEILRLEENPLTQLMRSQQKEREQKIRVLETLFRSEVPTHASNET
jgi:hypothetical protein